MLQLEYIEFVLNVLRFIICESEDQAQSQRIGIRI